MNSLNLHFPKTKCNILSIQNLTEYDDSETHISSIDIRTPASSITKYFNLEKGWCNINFLCGDFDICCKGESCLPDGNYDITYTVNEDRINVNHFRVCSLMKNYVKALCIYFKNKCSYNKKDLERIKRELQEIHTLIQQAVWAAEDCLDVKTAVSLYNEAASKLKTIYDAGDCPTCS